MYELIVLGGGPAGVAGGIYAARKKIRTLLLTKDFGGQSVNSAAIENWVGFSSISGSDFARTLESHVRAQEGIEIKDGLDIQKIERVGNAFRVTTSAGDFEGERILITLGSRYRRLGIPGEKEYEGKGVFYCSICDAPLMNGKNAAVIGGGNSGLEAAIDLLPYAKHVYLLEYSDSLKGDPVYQEQLENNDKVTILTHAETREIYGETFVTGLSYCDVHDKEKKERKTLDVSGVFVEIGYQPNSEIVADLVQRDDRGRIIVDHRTFQTSDPKIWAAGDITDTLYNQINPAMGDAVKAVLNIYDSLRFKKA